MLNRILLFIIVTLCTICICSECKNISVVLGIHYRYIYSPFTYILTTDDKKYIIRNIAALQDEAILSLIDNNNTTTLYLTHPDFPRDKILLEARYHSKDILSYSIIPRSYIHRGCYIPPWNNQTGGLPFKYRETSYSNTNPLPNKRQYAIGSFDNHQVWSRIKCTTNDNTSLASNDPLYLRLHTQYNSSGIYLTHYIMFGSNITYVANVATTEYSPLHQSSTHSHRIRIPKLNVTIIQPVHPENGSVSFFSIPIEAFNATLDIYTSFKNYFEYDINSTKDINQSAFVPLFKPLISATQNMDMVLDSIHSNVNADMPSINYNLSLINSSIIERFCSQEYDCSCMRFILATCINNHDEYIMSFQFSHLSNAMNIYAQHRNEYYKEHGLELFNTTGMFNIAMIK